MIERVNPWRRRLWLWLPALVFLLVNLGLYAAYRLALVGQFAFLERRLEEADRQQERAEEERLEVRELLDRAEINRGLVEELYRDRFATQSQRLTRAIEEVRSLTQQAGLDFRTMNYPEEAIEDYALIERSFVFSVEGTYQQLRTFINFLELSDSFITLRRVSLSEGSGGSRLRIQLELSTLFSTGEVAPPEVTS